MEDHNNGDGNSYRQGTVTGFGLQESNGIGIVDDACFDYAVEEKEPLRSHGPSRDCGDCLPAPMEEDHHGNPRTLLDDVLNSHAASSSENFEVGDVVWVRTKNQSWWPGKVCEGSGESENRLMVEYFGSIHATWCLPSQLKFFHEIVDGDAWKIRSRSYAGALEKAIDEFESRLRSEMPCSYIPNFTATNEIGRFGKFSITQLDPKSFLSELRNLGEVVPKLNRLDLTLIKARLSVFYKFIGHDQISWDELQEIVLKKDEFDEQEENPDAIQEEHLSKRARRMKSYKKSRTSPEFDANQDVPILPDSRERKKSKYLSFPFVHFGQKTSPEEKEERLTTGKKYEKTALNNTSFDLLPVSELLSDLCISAVDCQYPYEKDCFPVLEWFFSKFRVSVFQNEKGLNDEEVIVEKKQTTTIPDLNHTTAIVKESEANSGVEDVANHGITGFEDFF